MNKRLLVIFVAIILISGLLITSCGTPQDTTIPTPSTPAVVGKAAPDFTLSDINGNTIKLSSFKGKAVLVNFWATWCTPCMDEMPYMQEIYKNWTDKGLVFLSVDNGETLTKAKGFIDRYGYTFVPLVDPKGDVALRYNIRALPTTLLIDKDGILQYMLPGAFPSAKSIETEVLSKVFPVATP
jgi:cytochrome c biogenesis protein CcmG, thiol:disulfide interchange protein DsbE